MNMNYQIMIVDDGKAKKAHISRYIHVCSFFISSVTCKYRMFETVRVIKLRELQTLFRHPTRPLR